jgi:CRP-like cAMP-binding protein
MSLPAISPLILTMLSKTCLFANLPLNVLERLAAPAVKHWFEAGQVVYMEGKPAYCIYLIESGWVKATRMAHENHPPIPHF